MMLLMPRRKPDRDLAASYGVPVAERSVPPGTWTAERVLEALHDWTRLVGRPPAEYEWSPSRARDRGRPGASERWAREYPRWPEAATVVRYHGTWRAALLTAGLPGGRAPFELSLNERVEAARRMHAAGIRASMIASELDVKVGTVGCYLRASLCDCGRNWMVKGPRCSECAREEMSQIAAARRPRWDRQGVISALRRWTRLEGQLPSSEAWLGGRHAHGRWAREYPRWPSTAVVNSRFGSWNAAMAAARLPVTPYAYTDEDVIDALRADARRLGRTPTREDWRVRDPSVPGIGAVIRHFGSWNTGLRAAGLKATHEVGIWTPERALAALRRDAARRQRTPLRGDWSRATRSRPNSGTVEKLFGSWNGGLRAAGLEPNSEPGKWTRTSVLDALRRLERQLGRQPTSSYLTRPPPGYPNVAVIRRKLGSWGAVCRELGWHAEPRVISSDEQMLEALRAAASELGVEFAQEEYKVISTARGWPSANAITARFGAWNWARETAGLPVVRPQPRGWTREQLIRAFRAAARRLGSTPMARDWNRLAAELGWPHSATVARRLGAGSWERAIEEAGLAPRRRSTWTAEQVIALLRADASRRGRPPREHEWQISDASRPSSHRVKALFGSWNAALIEADLETYRPAA